jgi:hypothetical protein
LHSFFLLTQAVQSTSSDGQLTQARVLQEQPFLIEPKYLPDQLIRLWTEAGLKPDPNSRPGLRPGLLGGAEYDAIHLRPGESAAILCAFKSNGTAVRSQNFAEYLVSRC